MDWRIVLGLAVYALGASLQIRAGWRAHGLSATPYPPLLLLVLGPGLLTWAALRALHPLVALLAVAPAVLAAWLLLWKAYDAANRWTRGVLVRRVHAELDRWTRRR